MRKPFDELKLTGRLPSPPGVGMRILRLTQTDDFSQEDIASAIKSDPALTGKVLKMSNSARTASVARVTTVTEAVVRLGVRTVRNVALSFSLVSSYQTGSCDEFDYESFWSESLARAVAAQEIAARLKKVNPQEAYLCGLLSDIGRLALATVHPQTFATVLNECRGKSAKELVEAEKRAFEIDHREIGEALLLDWGLSAPQGRAVAIFELGDRGIDPQTGPAKGFAESLLLAETVGRICLANDNVPDQEWETFAEQLGKRGQPAEEAPAIAGQIVDLWKEWGQALDIKTPPTPKAPAKPSAKAKNGTPSTPVAIPDLPQSVVDVVTAAADATPSASGKVRILAVDDDKLSLKVLVRHLESNGNDVRSASNGADALRIALEWGPNVIVTDWMMPEMDGVELTRALRRYESGSRIYVVLLTGRAEEERIVEAFEAGIDDFVVKPFNPRVLLARVRAGERVVMLQQRVDEDHRRMESQVAAMAVMTRKLQQASLTDFLTELPNRRYAITTLQEEWSRLKEGAKAFSAIMVDIDHFKRVNDEFGHDVGDAVLQTCARTFTAATRETESVCRLGGEEFLVICKDTTLEGAMACAERLRLAMQEQRIKSGGHDLNVTVSLGVAEACASMEGIDELLKAADLAVYRAKAEGRNRVAMAQPAPV